MKRNSKRITQNEEMMFLGIDGFQEIENLRPETTLTPLQAVTKPRPPRSNRKRFALAIAAGVTAVMFSCATVAGAACGTKQSKQHLPYHAPAQPAAALGSRSCDANTSQLVSAEEEETRYFGLYIDDELMGVVKSGKALRKALDDMLLSARYSFDDETTTEFANKVEIKPCDSDAGMLTSVGELIANTEDLYSIKLETDWRYTEETDYDTEYTYDDSLPEGYKEVVQEGENGKTWVIMRLTYIDQKEVDENITSKDVLVEPVPRIVNVGTGDSEDSDDSYDEEYSYNDLYGDDDDSDYDYDDSDYDNDDSDSDYDYDDSDSDDADDTDSDASDDSDADNNVTDEEAGEKDAENIESDTSAVVTDEPETTQTETTETETTQTETTETETTQTETTETETTETETVSNEVTEGDSNESNSSNTTTNSEGFIWPLPHTHNITSYMEWRWGRMHNGIDIAGGDDYGMPFLAADSGTVIWAGNDGGGYGNYVMIDHGNGYITVYGHASSLACYTGQHVNQGDVIGYVGSTGNSTGPHLHFEIRLNGEYQNPLNYVS